MDTETQDAGAARSDAGSTFDAGTPAEPTDGGTIDEPTDGGVDGGAGDGPGDDVDVPDAGQEDDAGVPLPPFPDLALGPYRSVRTMFFDSARSVAATLDTSASYAHSAGQGYLLQAIGEVVWAARDAELPERAELLDLAVGEIEELQLADDRTVGGGPAFGLDYAWDAFDDGSENPAFTAYTWQSGMVALGVASAARALFSAGDPRAADVQAYGVSLVERWRASYTENDDGGYFWYSDRPSDAIAVHNTSALVAMASQILAESGADALWAARARACADLLWARMRGNPTDGYTWNYGDDGWPHPTRNAEDISHALVTTQLMRFAADRGWWASNRMAGVARTLLDKMWIGHPARLAGRVGGERTGNEWVRTRAAVIAYGAHGNAPGGDPAVFEVGRSLLFSSVLSRTLVPLTGGTVDAARTLALAMFLSRRPAPWRAGHDPLWEAMAGPDDTAPRPAGARFYHVDWAAPAAVTRGLSLPARVATAANANVVVDLPAEPVERMLVSIVWASEVDGDLRQWDGSAYDTLVALPATVADDGVVRWMRLTTELSMTDPFDYQQAIDGINVLLEVHFPAGVAVHSVEAVPLAP